MIAGRHIRKWRGAKVHISEIARRTQAAVPLWVNSRGHTSSAKTATRRGWSTFENAPKVDEFDTALQSWHLTTSITPPRRKGKPSGASIHVPEGHWNVTEQLREERDREL